MTHSESAHTEIDCQAATKQIWDFLDHELTPERVAAIRAHLDECAPCFASSEWGREFLAALGSCREGNHRAPPELRRRLADALRAEGYCGGCGETAAAD